MRATPWPSPSRPTSRPEAGTRPLPVILALALLFTALTSSAAPPPGGDQMSRLRAAFQRNMQQDDLDTARMLLAEMLRLEPANPLLHYNKACVTSRTGETGEALAALRRAAELGFDDVRTMEADPDLANLRRFPGYAELIGELVDDLLAMSRDGRLDLPDGVWRPLGALRDRSGGAEIDLDLMFDAAGVHLRATGPAAVLRPAGGDPRGGELRLTLTAPDSSRSFDTRRAWRFGFHGSGDAPRGRLLGLPGRPLNQPVADLAPAFAAGPAPGTISLLATVPWAYLAPYAPPADTLFGINVGHTGPGRFDHLVRDPALADPAAPWHRFRPVTLSLGADSPPLLATRLSTALAGAAPVTMEVSAWLPRGGAAILSTDVTDAQGTSVVSTGDTAENVDLRPGLNAWTRQADLSGLPDGPYTLHATLEPADGPPLAWRGEVLRYRGGWLSRTRDRAKPVHPLERPSVLWRLELIADELAGRDMRTYPAPLWTTIDEVEILLARHGGTASILPEAGTMMVACPAESGRLLQQTLVFEAGWDSADDEMLYVVLDAGGRRVSELAPLLADAAASGPLPARRGRVFACPALPAARPDVWDDGTRTAARTAVAWLRERFPGRPLALVTLDGSSAAEELRHENAAAVREAVAFAPGGDQIGALFDWLD